MATLSRFSFSVFGVTREEVLDKLDELEREAIIREGGEPWLATTDKINRECIDHRHLLDPKSWVYVGVREVVFAGPTILDKVDDQFRDGFRPQPGE